jgi:hypothetical protein
MGEPLPNRLRAELPAVLQAWEPGAPGRPAVPKGRLPLGLATACADLGAPVTAVQARIAALKAKRQGDRFAGFKATVELAATGPRVVWGVWQSGTPYDPRRTGGLQRQAR